MNPFAHIFSSFVEIAKWLIGIGILCAILYGVVVAVQDSMHMASDNKLKVSVIVEPIKLIPITYPDASVLCGPDAELEGCTEERPELVSHDGGVTDMSLDSGEDVLTRKTSGYCGCEPECCGRFAYDSNSGCNLCEILTE